jgi:predicted amidophosphoribosyltransferase
VGKITDHDFTSFEANLKQNAAQSLRALDKWEAEADDTLGAEIERAITARKAVFSGQMPEMQPDGRVCARCGRPALEGDKFCGGCGAQLPALTKAPLASQGAQLVCPSCGQPHQPGDKFCSKCGQSLVAEVVPAA